VAASALLTAFADKALAGDPDSLAAARTALTTALGETAMIDASAVIAGFDGITRIADATGIPLEPPKAEAVADLRATLQLDRFLDAKS
jgi:acid phosphatase family membrane protein YuiD